jgi:hypothetical protein
VKPKPLIGSRTILLKPEHLAVNSEPEAHKLARRITGTKLDDLKRQVRREWELLAQVASPDSKEPDPTIFEFLYVHASALAIFAEDVLKVLNERDLAVTQFIENAQSLKQ